MSLPPYRLPVPGDRVGAYRVLAHVGRGGQGHVFKAECAGRFFALKFFQARPVAFWGEREVDVLRQVRHPHAVRVLGYGRWPDPEEGLLYLVMEWVEGLTLEAHARVQGLSAREAATLLLEVVRALAEVHRQGVLHRDVKPDNIVVRRADGVPVLVDFGLGHQDGVRSVEGRGQVVGTPEFHSPQALDFLWEHLGDGTHYVSSAADEVWAVGVTLYWLLVRELPFGTRTDNPKLVRDIRTRTPEAPHARNPRVPVALSALCMRLLEKDPRARGEDMAAVDAALVAVLAGADASWDVMLAEPEPLPVEDAANAPGEAPEPLVPGHGAEPQPEGFAPPPGPRAAEESPAFAARGRVGRAPPPARARRNVGRREALVLAALAVVTVGVWLLASRLGTGEAGVSSSHGLAREGPTPHTAVFREVAGPEQPGEAGVGALPYLSSLPASEFSKAMLHKPESPSKSAPKPAPRPPREAPRCVPLRQETCVAGLCIVLLTGCSATPQVVRLEPKRAECPPGAVETMTEQLDIPLGEVGRGTGEFPIEGGARRITVSESTPVRLGLEQGKLWAGTVLTGRLYLGAERVYGRFTQARTYDGKTYPVCMELFEPGKNNARGLPRYDVGGPADSAVVYSTVRVQAVDHFE